MSILEYLAYSPIALLVTLLILGLIVGSFLNVVILRYPVMLQRLYECECRDLLKLPQENHQEKFNLVFPHSHCPSCKTPIKPWQNIPVISYLLLKGKCANCSTSISMRYPLVELIAGLLALLSGWYFGFSLNTITACLLLWALLTLTMIDFDHQILPDDITLPLLWVGLLINFQWQLFTTIDQALWGVIAGYLTLWCVYWLFKLLTQKEGMGYGDFKLLAMLGAWLGWKMLPLIILLSSFIGAIIGGLLILFRGHDHQIPIPFGPYLAGAGAVALFWGETIVQQYFQLAGF
ncbi:prepilin peptidase [Zooshikella harenae]|uniref:Prepilin leader peptidase/N-methyltransferase n=1 Tax=Zooshikella harenae TaxID=2827238 RepID=A0ABS5Z866_9GAMM|nr:A24 family peptidase [Zooshikella harenae]MBU2710241.1 prepilin peptidase [Zooshikella harenae]